MAKYLEEGGDRVLRRRQTTGEGVQLELEDLLVTQHETLEGRVTGFLLSSLHQVC